MILLTFPSWIYFNFGSCPVCLWRLQKFFMELICFSFMGIWRDFLNTFWIWSLIRYTLLELEVEVELVRIISGVCTEYTNP